MSRRAIKLREQLAASTVAAAAPRMMNILRRTAQQILFEYAIKNRIVTFEDTAFVQQAHRDWKENVRSTAASYAADIQAASTIDELLVVFDQLEPWIE